jgi:predicted RNA-binding protein with PIN domain
MTGAVMAYIVDGNNVMGQTPGWHRDRAGARKRLLEQLARFAKAKRKRVTVVFDGGPDLEFPEGSAFRGVKILYARKGSNADARILNLVETSADPKGLIVVTSDRQLAHLVRSGGAAVSRSGEFRKQLEEIALSSTLSDDNPEIKVDDLDGWLRYFGEGPEE